MVLPLITPVGSNFLKDFVSQNAINCDLIDDYSGPSLITHPLQSWTPQLTAVTTNPTLGTGGFNRGFFYEIFDQIYAWGEFRFGTAGTNAGSGIYSMSLPFTAKTIVGIGASLGKEPILGTGYIFNAASSTARTPVTVHLRTANTVAFGVQMNSGSANREVTQIQPNAWTINDGLTWFARFQRLP